MKSLSLSLVILFLFLIFGVIGAAVSLVLKIVDEELKQKSKPPEGR